MIQEIFYINNSQVNPPKNWQGLFIELNYGKDQFPNANTISITDFEWVRENYDWFQKYIDDGLTGGVGITEAPPFRIDITDGKTTRTVFNGFIDFTSNAIFTNKRGNLPGPPDGKITAKATSHATVDWLNDVAGGFTFEYLASKEFKATGLPGYISSDMYVFVPYVNSKVPNYEQAALATLMAYSIGKSIKDEVEALYNLCAEVIANWSDVEITEIIKIAIKVTYLVALLATIVKLIEDMVKYVLSPVKYHAGMRVRDLMAKGVEYLSEGKMTFVSDIWAPGSPYYNEVIIPEKLYNAPSKSDSSIFGFLVPDKNEQEGFYKGTFAQLLEAMKVKYNAKVVVIANSNGIGTVQLLRKDKHALPPSYQLPDIYEPEYSFNLDDLNSNYEIQYQTDGQDTNTLQNYFGTVYQVTTQQKVVNYRPFVMLKNLTVANIPFAKAVRKTSLTTPEKIISDFIKGMFDDINNIGKVLRPLIKIYDKIGGVNTNSWSVLTLPGAAKKVFKKNVTLFGQTPAQIYIGLSLGGPVYLLGEYMDNLIKNSGIKNIGDRIGMMLLSDDHFSVPKVLILDESKSGYKFNRINVNSETTESAKSMWEEFHYVNSFIPKQLYPAYSDRPTGNQYKIQHFEKIPFTWSDFLKVVANNRIYDANGNEAVLESLKFNPYLQVADVKVRFGQIYTLNLVETFLNPDGR